MAHAARLGSAAADEKANLIRIGLFRLQAIVHFPNPLTHLSEQAGRFQWSRTGFHEKFILGYLYGLSTEEPACKRIVRSFQKRCIRTRRVYRPGFAVYITLKLMKVRTIHSAEDADELISLTTRSATKALAQVSELTGTSALNALWAMKVRPVGCDPLDAETPLNLIEQLNQTFTYIASARAVKVLLSLHPEMAPFTLNLGTSPGSDIESKRGVGLVAEVFAAVVPSNNKKLNRDIGKVAAVTGAGLKYVFFMCPGYREGRHPKLEPPGVFVWSVEAEA